MIKFVRYLILLIGLIGLGFSAQASPIQAQEAKTFEWQRLDVDLTVLSNGNLRVVEKNVIRFTSGRFTFGFRDINQSRLTDIREVKVTEGSESSEPIRHETAFADNGDFRIKYYFARPAQNEVRTVTLAYTVSGALRYYEGGDQLYWAAIYASRNGFPVKRSTITVNLPGVSAQHAETNLSTTITAEPGEQTLTIVANEPIPSGEELEVRVQFPHGVVQGSPAPWQAAFDRQREYDETVRPRNDLLALLASLVAAIGGPALALVTWVTRGRDPNVGLVAEYLTEPPNVSPGVAGALVDEKADTQDVIATFVDLARRGIITMKETRDERRLMSIGGAPDFEIAPGPNYENKTLAPHEQKLWNALNLNGEAKLMSQLKNKFYRSIPGIQQGLYDQLVSEGFYNATPPNTRNKWNSLGWMALIGSVAVGFGAVTLLSGLTNNAICLPIGLAVTAVIFLIMAPHMPRATRAGAEMKMRAQAFKRYLANIEKYTSLKEATDQFDKYLPYAIAFGIDRTWVQKFSRVETPAPPWYIPYGYDYGYGYGRRPVIVNSSGGNRGIGDVLDGAPNKGDVSDAARAGRPGGIEGINQGLAIGLASINSNLTGMFQSVSNTFTSQPAPVASSGGTWSSGSGGSWSSSSSSSGGGWSGGGSSSGGSSGGGGGGFG
jgi:uncharacterized membrane protein YgcG